MIDTDNKRPCQNCLPLLRNNQKILVTHIIKPFDDHSWLGHNVDQAILQVMSKRIKSNQVSQWYDECQSAILNNFFQNWSCGVIKLLQINDFNSQDLKQHSRLVKLLLSVNSKPVPSSNCFCQMCFTETEPIFSRLVTHDAAEIFRKLVATSWAKFLCLEVVRSFPPSTAEILFWHFAQICNTTALPNITVIDNLLDLTQSQGLVWLLLLRNPELFGGYLQPVWHLACYQKDFLEAGMAPPPFGRNSIQRPEPLFVQVGPGTTSKKTPSPELLQLKTVPKQWVFSSLLPWLSRHCQCHKHWEK